MYKYTETHVWQNASSGKVCFLEGKSALQQKRPPTIETVHVIKRGREEKSWKGVNLNTDRRSVLLPHLSAQDLVMKG